MQKLENQNKFRDFKFGGIDLRLFAILIGIYSGFLLLTMLKTIYFISISSTPVSAIPFHLFFIDWITVVGFISFIAWNTRKLLNKHLSWGSIVAIHFLLAVVVNAGIRFFIEIYIFLQVGWGFEQITFTALFRRYMAYVDINYLIYFVMIFIIYAYYYTEQIKHGEKQKRILETQLLTTKLQLLSSQIQPHFLFNTLNAIVCLIKEDQNKAINTVIDLSDFLRTVLSLKNEQFVTVQEEFDILNKYVEIIKTRFDDQIEICQKIESEVLRSKIPLLIIQPLFENAIKHGFQPGLEQLKIQIKVKKMEEFLYIQISNNGKPLHPSIDVFKRGTGLSNIHQRLDALYNKDFIFTVESLPQNKGIVNILKLPFLKD